MSAPGVGVLQVRSGPEFGGGTLVAGINEVTDVRITERLDGLSELVIEAPDTAEWLEGLKARQVIRVSPPGLPVTEWMVAGRGRERAAGSGAATQVTADDLWALLADVGVLDVQEAGGPSRANLGGVNINARNYLNTFLVPFLVRHGIGWIKVGLVESLGQFTRTFDAVSALGLVHGLTEETGLERVLRRDEVGEQYLIDLVDRVGSGFADVWATEGRTILQLVEERTREELYTVIRPRGTLPNGGVELADIGWNAWRVDDVTAAVLTLAPHQGGLGPILEDGQLVGRYIAGQLNTLTEIIATTAPDLVEVASAAGIAEGHDVSIVADASGSLLTEVPSPSGITEFGRVQGVVATGMAGHRNWVRNPFFARQLAPEVVIGRADGAQSSATLNFKSMAVGKVIAVDDVMNTANASVRVTAGGTVDGSGNVTVTVHTSRALDDDERVGFVLGPQALENWAALNEATYRGTPSLDPVTMTAQIVGGVPLNTYAGAMEVNGLTEGDVIPSGAFIREGATYRGAVGVAAAADGTGKAVMTCWFRSGTAITAGDTLTFEARAPEDGGYTGVSFPRFTFGVWDSALFGIRDAEAQAHVNVRGWGFSALTSTSGGWAAGAGAAPRVELRNGGGTTLAASSSLAVWDPTAALEVLPAHFQASFTPSADDTYLVRLVPPADRGTLIPASMFFWRSVSVHLGPDANAATIEGSEATRMFQEGNIALLAHRQWPATYTCTVQEIVDAWGIDASSPALGLGGMIRLRAPSLSETDLLLRVVQMEWSPLDPGQRTLLLDTSPASLVKQTAAQRPRNLFVDVVVEVDEDGRGRRTALVSDSPPSVPGTVRAEVAPGITSPGDDSAVPLKSVT